MIRLALIGTGAWGTNIKRVLENMSGVELLSSDSPNETKNILQQSNIDGVLVATPGSTHAQIALPFINKGWAVFIEKPLATSLKDAERIASAANKYGAQVMVGHIHLYNPAYRAAKEAASQAGLLLALHFLATNNGPFRSDMSALWDWSPHDVAAAIDLVGKNPRTVQAWGIKSLRPKTKLYDTVHLKLNFRIEKNRQKNDIVATIHNSWLAPRKQKSVSITAARNTIVFDDVAEKRKVTIWQGLGPQPVTAKLEYPRYSETTPLEIEMKAFIDLIEKNIQPVSNLSHAICVTRVLDAAERSIALDGKSVTI